MILFFSNKEAERIFKALKPWPNESDGKISEQHFAEFTERCKEEVLRFIELAEEMKDEPQVWTGLT